MQMSSQDLLLNAIEGLHISISRPTRNATPTSKTHRKRKITGPYELVQNDAVLDIDLVRYSLTSGNVEYVNEVLSYRTIEKCSKTFKEIKALFIKNRLCVTSVQGVINPYLKQAFQLTRELCYNDIEPIILFHGTKEKYVENICTFNFDWRYSGTEKGHRYGKGVNFSKNPYFAAFFCDKTKGFAAKGTIIMTEVLVDVVSPGTENLIVPPKGSDTTKGKGSNVLVKFYDNEFYPKYVIRFVRVKS